MDNNSEYLEQAPTVNFDDLNTIESFDIDTLDNLYTEEDSEEIDSNTRPIYNETIAPDIEPGIETKEEPVNEISEDNNIIQEENKVNEENNFDETVLDQIKNINDEIIRLEQELNSDESIPNTTLQSEKSFKNDNINNIFNNTETLNNSDSVENVVEVSPVNEIENNPPQDNSLNKIEISKQIIKLNQLKESLVKQVLEKQINGNATKNIFEETGPVVTVDNFTPNFAFLEEDEQESIDKAVATEQKLGKKPKLVTDSKGAPAIISEDQVDLKSAIEQHGGIDEAISDSVNNQTFVNSNNLDSFEPTDVFNDVAQSFNQVENIENMIGGLMPDNFNSIAENTGMTISVLKDLLGQFNVLSNSINKGFSNTVQAVKGIKNSQNITNNNYEKNNNLKNFNTGGSTNSGNSEPRPIPTTIRGDFPLKEDFPPNFDLTTLRAGNLRR